MKEQSALLALGVLGIGALLALASTHNEVRREQPETRRLATWERDDTLLEQGTQRPDLIPAAPGGAAQAARDDQTDEKPADLRIYSSVVARVSATEPLRSAFIDAQSRVDPLLHTSSDRNAIEHVITGKADVAIVAVGLSKQDMEHGATAIMLGEFIPAIVVHHDNPLRTITKAQARDLFRGATENWSAFGYNLGKIGIMRPASKGLQNFYSELVMPGDSFIDGETYSDEDSLYDALAADTKRIGITNLAHLDVTRCRTLAIGNFLASSYDFRMGMYPYGRSLILVYKGMPSNELQAFLDFVRSAAGEEALSEHLSVR